MLTGNAGPKILVWCPTASPEKKKSPGRLPAGGLPGGTEIEHRRFGAGHHVEI
jgi:hypothetical protein